MRENGDITPPELQDLGAKIRAESSSAGSATEHIDASTLAVHAWHRAAHAAGRELGRPAETAAAGDSVHAGLRDRPANDDETAKDRAAISYETNPGSLQWHIGKNLAATWVVKDILAKTARAGLVGIVSQPLKAKSNKAVAAYTVVHPDTIDVAAGLGEAEAVDTVVSTVEVAAKQTSCATAWTRTENAIKKFPTLADDVAEAGHRAGNVSKVRLIWGWV